MNKKVFIIPISLAAFLASCATNGTISSNLDKIDGQEDLYTAKLEIKRMGYRKHLLPAEEDWNISDDEYIIGNRYMPSDGQLISDESAIYTVRKYDNHNLAIKEDSYSLTTNHSYSKIAFDDPGTIPYRWTVQPEYESLYASSAYVNGYDNDKIISRVNYYDRLVEMPEFSYMPFYQETGAGVYVGPVSFSYREKGYNIEKYVYDNQNRLVTRTIDRTSSKLNEPGGEIIDPTYPYFVYPYQGNSEISTRGYISFGTLVEEKYTYEGNLRDFKTSQITTHNKHSDHELVTTNNGFVNYIDPVIVRSTTRDFDNNGNIIKETFTTTRSDEEGNIKLAPFMSNEDNYVKYNTYDEHNCLVKSQKYLFDDNEEPYISTETATTYYKNNPHKVLTSFTVEHKRPFSTEDIYIRRFSGASGIIINNVNPTIYSYRKCSYDENDRLKTDLVISVPRYNYYDGPEYHYYGGQSTISFDDDINTSRMGKVINDLSIYYYK